ncbi:MAG: sigma-54 dependent transcriptional regulator [Bacillota bacterium]
MEEPRVVMLVDDELDMLETCSRVVKKMGYKPVNFNEGAKAVAEMEKIQPDLIITDLKMPEVDGFQVLKVAKELFPDTCVIVITGYASIDTAVRAMKGGARDYLAKPFSVDELQIVIEKALREKALREENRLLRMQIQEPLHTENIIGANGGLQEIFRTIGKLGGSEAAVLIKGESGTGKELIARSVHKNSNRSLGPFIPVDCASLPDNLLESELFGHEKGAFTGAHMTKKGLMELADKGTLFLDEIGEMSPILQAKLLRALEERSFRRVGGNQLIKVDFRLVSATNRDLEEAIQHKEFRDDLYYRINVINLKLPPLRERQQDIPLLVYFFSRKFAETAQKKISGVSAETMEILQSYNWPGNVRELKNVIERAISLCEGETILPEDLPPNLLKNNEDRSNQMLFDLPFHVAKQNWVKDFEIKYIENLLEKHDGNVTQAAITAEIDRKTIHRLLNKYNLI